MILLVDIGNTRIKWALFEGREMSPSHAEVHQAWTSEVAKHRMLAALAKPTRVLIANVAGPGIADVLKDAVQLQWSLVPEFVQSTREAAGVRNGYRIPEQLGVDRWLAAIAAYHLEKRAVCVASVGTALTVDCVDAQGLHLGGIIVPGPDLMIESLFRDTSDIAQRAHSPPPNPTQASVEEASTLFADNTLAAVNQGTAHALAAIMERAHADLSARTGAPSALVLSGGAAGRIEGLLRVPFRSAQDLVLRGLAELARA
jgi:type III pantothenate kinase